MHSTVILGAGYTGRYLFSLATVIRRSRRLVVLGSTSAYHLPEGTADPLIDESWPVNMGLPRVRGEEYLRLNALASIEQKGR